MAFNAGTVRGELDLNAKKFLAALKKVNTGLGKTATATKKATGAQAQMRKGMGRTVVKIAALVSAYVGLKAIIKGTSTLMTESSQAARDFELVVRSLSTSLGLQGARNITGTVDALREYASELQRTTAFSDNFTLKVAQTLTVLGVQQKDLKKYTKAILDYSSATGNDAVTAARLFGKTFGGALGELSEALPALKSLTKEQLEAGEAFEFAAKAFAGFSEEVAASSAGLKSQAENAFGDLQKQLGAVINPFKDEWNKFILGIWESWTAGVDENRGAIIESLKTVALSFIDTLGGVANTVTEIRLAMFDFQATVGMVLPSIVGGWYQMRLAVEEAALAVLKFNNTVTLGLADALDKALTGTGIANYQALVDRLRADVDGMAGAFGEMTREAEAGRKAILDQGAAVNNFLSPALAKIREAVSGITSDFAESARKEIPGMALAINSGKKSVVSLNEEVTQTAQQLADAKEEAMALEVALSGAAAQSTRMSGGGRGGSGGGGGGGGSDSGADSFGRRPGQGGGMLGGNIFQDIGQLQTMENRLRHATGVMGSVGSNFVGQMRAQVKGEIDMAIADFQRGIIAELNRAGIFDPAERSRTVSSRLNEAIRLGIIPDPNLARGGGYLA